MLVLLSGCGTSSFDYSAEIDWNARTTPGIQAVAVHGNPVATGDIIEQTYSDLGAGLASSIEVDVMTTSGNRSFQIVPTRCGGTPSLCGSSGLRSCDDITSERDRWSFSLLTDGTLSFFTDEGSCTFTDGSEDAWIDG